MAFTLGETKRFRRLLDGLIRKHVPIIAYYEDAVAVLETDPYNHSRQYKIKKLTNINTGDGCWRLSVGEYRIRYDIVGTVVTLKLIRHRRDSYGGKDA